MQDKNESLAEFELAVARGGSDTYVLRLYISGATQRSAEAIRRIKEICEEYLPGQYDLEVINICRRPKLAAENQIIAAPTLVKEAPGTRRRFVGDLSNTGVVLDRLGVAH